MTQCVQAERADYRFLQYGTITTPADMAFARRLQTIYDDMTKLLQTLRPDALSIEELFFGHNVTTGIGVAHGRGVILLCASQAGVPIYEYEPRRIKMAVCGNGLAEKLQIQRMVKTLLALPELPQNDAADALGLAITHVHGSSVLNTREPI